MIRLAILREKRRDSVKLIKKMGFRIIPSIPHFFTLINASCGFLAMIKASEGNVLTAAYLIVFAACIDALDGKLARALHCSSPFGCELDSLADAVSFCSAPMVIMYQVLRPLFPYNLLPFLCLYICAGIWRLARFNVVHAPTFDFCGLPTTAAALTLAGLIIYEPWLTQHITMISHTYVFLSAIVILGALMISSIGFKKITVCLGKTPLQKVLLVLLCASFVISHYYGLPTVLVFIFGYIAGTLSRAIYLLFTKIILYLKIF